MFETYFKITLKCHLNEMLTVNPKTIFFQISQIL